MSETPDRSAAAGAPIPGPDVVHTYGTAAPQRWARTSAAEHIEETLSDLWREVSQAGGPKVRSVMSNLIVYAEGDPAHADPAELAEVSRLHPSRVIVVRYERAGHAGAEVAVHAHGTGVAQFGVEHVTLTSGNHEAIPSLLRRLIVGELPTSICWGASTLPSARTIQDLAPLGRQFVYDSSVWPNPLESIRAVAPMGSRPGTDVDVADLTWRRLKPLRHAIVQAVDPTVLPRPVGTLRAVTIEAGTPERAMAWLLAAWIASRLGWKPVQRTQTDTSAAIVFESPAGRTTVDITYTAREGLRAAIETDALPGAPLLDAVQWGDEIVVRYGWDVPPLTLMAPRRSRAEMLAAELRNLYVDSYLRDALNLAARIETL